MNSQLIEILLISLILSLYINALHIAFQKEMFLNWLYNLLEKVFKNSANIRVCDLDYKIMQYAESSEFNVYHNEKYDITQKIKVNVHSKEKAEYFDSKWNTLKFCHVIEESKWRNSKGLLYIAKPIYSCASCMPSLHSLPLLLILPLWKVAIIAVISVTISTLINDKIFE